MVKLSLTEQRKFLNKVVKATDNVSHAKLIEEIKRMIEREPELLKARIGFGENCFHCIKSVELAEFIYNRYPSLINERKDNGQLPIHSAAYNGRLPIVKFIAEKDPTMLHATAYCRMTPLLYACWNAHFNVVKWILTRDPSTANHVDNDGWTALHWVALRETGPGALECAKLLLKTNAEIRGVEDNGGKTPVMFARAKDCYSELTLFLEKLEKHDESIADAKSFLQTVKVMLRAMEEERPAMIMTRATKTKKTAIDALVVVAEWTENMAANMKSDIVNLIQK